MKRSILLLALLSRRGHSVTDPAYHFARHPSVRSRLCYRRNLFNGISPRVVMKWTGCSDYQAMKPYIAIAEKTKADAMKLFDERK